MFTRLFKRRDDASAPLYAQIVAQARRPEFYTIFHVPDTVDGRFDVLILHAVLFHRRLKGADERAAALSQAVFDAMFADLDQNVRELGASDVTVGKKVKKMAAAFYGRAAAYDTALGCFRDRPQELEGALGRNVFPGIEIPGAALRAFAVYVDACARRLDETALADIMAGRIAFAEPVRATQEGSVA
jgi:cytochrome b pre-mRNA-processing protein 3